MYRLPMAALFIALWIALGTKPLQAQAALRCDYGRTYYRAHGEVRGNQYRIAVDDNLTRIAERFCVTKDELKAANNIVNEHLILAGQDLTIPGLGPQRSAGCTSSDLTIFASQPDPQIPQIAVTGTGCGLTDNTVDIWRQSGNSNWSHSQRDSVLLTPASEGEVMYSARLDASSEQGQTMRLFAEAGQKRSDPISIYVNRANIVSPRPACTAADVQITSPALIPQGLATFSVSVTARPNCTMTVSIYHSRQGRISENTIETGPNATLRVPATLAPNSYLGDTVTIYARILQTGVERSLLIPITGSTSAREVADLEFIACEIYLRDSSHAIFAYPGGPSMGSVAGYRQYHPLRVAVRNGEAWYAIQHDGRQSDNWIQGLSVDKYGTCDP
jgi:LysM repeat protein